MRYARFIRSVWILILSLGLLVGDGWTRATARISPVRVKAREPVGRAPQRKAVSRKKTRSSGSKAGQARPTSRRIRRTSRRRGRRARYRQVWTASSFADSTAGDRVEGEDPVVREAAVNALGPLNGSIVVADPNTGRILSIVNQNVALAGGHQPCSTIKLPVALAALHEGIITKDTPVRLSRRWSLTLTEALAHSNNPYFALLGREIGFPKLKKYAGEFGFGELAGYGIEGEQLGAFPRVPPPSGVGRVSTFGDEVSVTPLQLAAFVSAIANGGRLYYLQYPRSQAELETFEPRVKRVLDVQEILPELREGMMAAVLHGTARSLSNPYDQVLGKTGTCSEGGTRLGWFASYENTVHPRLVVVVLLRGGRLTVGPLAAEVAGRVYRTLHERNYYAQRRQPDLNPPSPAP